MGHDQVNMAKAIAEFGYYTERVEGPDKVSGALQRALAANDNGQSSYLEIVCSQFPVYGKWAPKDLGKEKARREKGRGQRKKVPPDVELR